MRKAYKIALLFPLAVAAALFSACREPERDGRRLSQEFWYSVSHPYTASEQRRAQITGNYRKVRRGQTKEEVASVLGEPDFSDNLIERAYFGYRTFGTKWVYSLSADSQFVGTSGTDRYISVYFDMGGKVDGLSGRTDADGEFTLLPRS